MARATRKTRTTKASTVALKESAIPAATYTGDDDPRAAEYRRLGNTTRDLQPIQFTTAQRMSYFLWQRNPIARRMIQILVDFSTGDEFKVTNKIKRRMPDGTTIDTKKSEAQQIWDMFAKDPINRLDEDFPQFLQDLLINGELVLPATVNLRKDALGNKIGNGKVRLGYIDPVNIASVITEPFNVREVRTLMVRPMDGSADEVPIEVARIDTDPNSPTFERYIGNCLYFRINKVVNQKRGHPQLLDKADWLDALDQFLFDALEGMRLRNSFFYDLEMVGKDEEELTAYASKITVPANGAVRVHNEKAKYDVITPDLKSQDIDKALLSFETFVVGSAGFPIMWFGSGDNTNRATASEMGIPTVKMLRSVQNMVRLLVKKFAAFAIDMAVQAGEITLGKDEFVDTEVSMYDFEKKDSTDLSQAFTQMVQGLTLAVDKGWVSAETSKKIMDGFVTRLGVEVDPDETIEENLAELAEDKQEEAQNTYKGVAAPPPGKKNQPTPPDDGTQEGVNATPQESTRILRTRT